MIGAVTNWYDVDDLPRFELPPVVETAMAVEFAPIPELDAYRLAKLQDRWIERFPIIESRLGSPSLPPGEGLGPVVFNMNGPITRLWASSPGDGLLIQTQSDRLILNWRKDQSTGPYPGFQAELRPTFVSLWGELSIFLADQNLQPPQPLVAEFNYVNSVVLRPDDTLGDVITLIKAPVAELPGAERVGRFEFSRQVTASAEDPFTAEIVTTGLPEQRPDGSHHLVLTVVCRALISPWPNAAIEAIDAAHALASHSFARTVTSERAEQWRAIR